MDTHVTGLSRQMAPLHAQLRPEANLGPRPAQRPLHKQPAPLTPPRQKRRPFLTPAPQEHGLCMLVSVRNPIGEPNPGPLPKAPLTGSGLPRVISVLTQNQRIRDLDYICQTPSPGPHPTSQSEASPTLKGRSHWDERWGSGAQGHREHCPAERPLPLGRQATRGRKAGGMVPSAAPARLEEGLLEGQDTSSVTGGR